MLRGGDGRAPAAFLVAECAEFPVWGGGRGGEEAVPGVDPPGTIQELADLDAHVGVTPAARARGDVDHDGPAEADGVVAQDGGLIAKAANALEIHAAPHGTPGGRLVPRRHSEAAIVRGPIVRQHGVGVLARGRARQAQLGHEPILERTPQAFNAALRLRGQGIDRRDLERLEREANVVTKTTFWRK